MKLEKTHEPKKPKISAWVHRRLRSIPGLDSVGEPQSKSRYGRIKLRAVEGRFVQFDVVEDRTISEERAHALAETTSQGGPRLLVATLRLTPSARAVLREAGISWIEKETGRCRMSGPGLLVEIEMKGDAWRKRDATRSQHPKVSPALLRDKSGLLAEALLVRDPKAQISVTALAAESGLSIALVSRLFARLTELGILEAHGRRPRKQWTLRDPAALLDRWADEERSEPDETTHLSVWSRTTEDFLTQLAQIEESHLRYAVGGVVAANLYAPSLTATPIPEIWIPAELSASKFGDSLGARVVESGANLRIMQHRGDAALIAAQTLSMATSRFPGLRVISKYRAFVEARRSAGRGPDVASALRRAMQLRPASPASANA